MRNFSRYGGIDEAYRGFPLVPVDEIDNGGKVRGSLHCHVCLDNLIAEGTVANFQRIARKCCYYEVGCEEVLNHALSQCAAGLYCVK